MGKVNYCQEAAWRNSATLRLLPLAINSTTVWEMKKAAPAQPVLKGKYLLPPTLCTHSGLSGELCPDVDEVLLQQPLLVGNLLEVLGLISVLLHLSVQHLQHGF